MSVTIRAQPDVRARETLPSGVCVTLCGARTDDDARLYALFYRLSPTTIYQRLFLPAPKLPHWAERFAAFATCDALHHAVVALIGDEVIGIANYAITSGNGPDAAYAYEAEMAIVVEDGWQRRGVGRTLMAHLVAEAAQHQVTLFTATILGDNARALRFITRFFPTARVRWAGGEYEARIPLE